MHFTPSWLQGHGRHYVSHNAPVEYKDLGVAISTRAGPAEDDPPLYKTLIVKVQMPDGGS